MNSMIDGVLLYSSFNAIQQSNEKINLNETIDQIQADLEVIINQTNAVIKHNLLPTIEGSSILVYQLFYNLINNSIKFRREGVPPIIECVAEPIDTSLSSKNGKTEYIKIILQDNGIGFNDYESDQIFKTFTRLNPKDKYEGTGLGLSLCKKIAERHNGSIKASGNPGTGAIFKIILPVCQ